MREGGKKTHDSDCCCSSLLLQVSGSSSCCSSSSSVLSSCGGPTRNGDTAHHPHAVGRLWAGIGASLRRQRRQPMLAGRGGGDFGGCVPGTCRANGNPLDSSTRHWPQPPTPAHAKPERRGRRRTNTARQYEDKSTR